MCGFVAIVGKEGQRLSTETLVRMTQAIEHRGPDDFGYFEKEAVSFGFRRLSILDLSPLGHQPMTSQNGRYTIVFNGEIYNYRELRDELAGHGYSFRSSGDTEVLLAAFQHWGPACLGRLNGMWAFAIYDSHAKTVFGSRDRFGIKPLFFQESAKGFVFASEIKSVRVCDWYQTDVNLKVLAAYVQRTALDQTNETFFAGINQVMPGHAFSIDEAGHHKTWSYWQLNEEGASGLDRHNVVEDFANLFESSMSLHMRSDVPVGVNLSGGLDSTSIICAAARLREQQSSGQELLAFSYFDEAFDERQYVEATVRQTGAKICRLETSAQKLWQSLDGVMAFQDEPVHSMSAVVGNQLMGLAREHGVKVLLNGQGADETLAGYPNYFQDYWSSLLSQGRFVEAWKQVSGYADGHGRSTRELYGASLKRLLSSLLANFSAYQNAQIDRRRSSALNAEWLHPELRREEFSEPIVPSPNLKQSLRDSIIRTPLPLYLRVEDRNSMQHSIEARVPFLDFRMVEFAFNCHDSSLLDGPWNKKLLREAMSTKIPSVVAKRIDKMGFPTSFGDWLKTWLYDECNDLLQSANADVKKWVNHPLAVQRLKEHRDGKANHSQHLFGVIQVIKWHQSVSSS
jgi:asparagine synthase (glutamine-hydrolysing)